MVATTAEKRESKSRLNVNFDNIPEPLKRLNNWVLWRYEARGDKRTKVPYNPKVFFDLTEDKRASSTDPRTWGTFDTVSKIYREHPDQLDGIGIVLRSKDGIIGIDGDNVLGTPTFDTLKQHLSTYGEVSPSGKGCRFFGFGTLPDNRGRKRVWLELYNDARFLTITGNILPDNEHAMTDIQKPVDKILAKFFADPAPAHTTANPVLCEDEQVLEVALECDNGKFNALWNCHEAELKELGFGKEDGSIDRSRVHAALCAKLAYYTRDANQIERLMSASVCGQDGKWDTREKYRKRTIDNALNLVSDHYKWGTSDDDIARVIGTWGTEADPVDDDELYGTYDGLEMYRRSKASKTDYLFGELLETGVITLFSGLPYSGKSLVTLQLIRSLLTGESFYGFPCTKAGVPVLYINADRLRDRQFHRRLETICQGDEAVLLGILPRIQFSEVNDLPSTVTGDYLTRLIRGMKKRHKADTVLVVIDTMRPAFLNEQAPGAENDPGTMTQLLGPIRAVAGNEGVPVLLLHHNGKASNRYSGSAAIAGNTDAVWTIVKEDGKAFATVDVENRDNGNQLFTVKLGETATATVTDADYFATVPKGKAMSRKDVSEAIGVPLMKDGKLNGTVRRRIDEAVLKGTVTQSGDGTNDNPYLYTFN